MQGTKRGSRSKSRSRSNSSNSNSSHNSSNDQNKQLDDNNQNEERVIKMSMEPELIRFGTEEPGGIIYLASNPIDGGVDKANTKHTQVMSDSMNSILSDLPSLINVDPSNANSIRQHQGQINDTHKRVLIDQHWKLSSGRQTESFVDLLSVNSNARSTVLAGGDSLATTASQQVQNVGSSGEYDDSAAVAAQNSGGEGSDHTVEIVEGMLEKRKKWQEIDKIELDVIDEVGSMRNIEAMESEAAEILEQEAEEAAEEEREEEKDDPQKNRLFNFFSSAPISIASKFLSKQRGFNSKIKAWNALKKKEIDLERKGRTMTATSNNGESETESEGVMLGSQFNRLPSLSVIQEDYNSGNHKPLSTRASATSDQLKIAKLSDSLTLIPEQQDGITEKPSIECDMARKSQAVDQETGDGILDKLAKSDEIVIHPIVSQSKQSADLISVNSMVKERANEQQSRDADVPIKEGGVKENPDQNSIMDVIIESNNHWKINHYGDGIHGIIREDTFEDAIEDQSIQQQTGTIENEIIIRDQISSSGQVQVIRSNHNPSPFIEPNQSALKERSKQTESLQSKKSEDSQRPKKGSQRSIYQLIQSQQLSQLAAPEEQQQQQITRKRSKSQIQVLAQNDTEETSSVFAPALLNIFSDERSRIKKKLNSKSPADFFLNQANQLIKGQSIIFKAKPQNANSNERIASKRLEPIQGSTMTASTANGFSSSLQTIDGSSQGTRSKYMMSDSQSLSIQNLSSLTLGVKTTKLPSIKKQHQNISPFQKKEFVSQVYSEVSSLARKLFSTHEGQGNVTDVQQNVNSQKNKTPQNQKNSSIFDKSNLKPILNQLHQHLLLPTTTPQSTSLITVRQTQQKQNDFGQALNVQSISQHSKIEGKDSKAFGTANHGGTLSQVLSNPLESINSFKGSLNQSSSLVNRGWRSNHSDTTTKHLASIDLANQQSQSRNQSHSLSSILQSNISISGKGSLSFVAQQKQPNFAAVIVENNRVTKSMLFQEKQQQKLLLTSIQKPDNSSPVLYSTLAIQQKAKLQNKSSFKPQGQQLQQQQQDNNGSDSKKRWNDPFQVRKVQIFDRGNTVNR